MPFLSDLFFLNFIFFDMRSQYNQDQLVKDSLNYKKILNNTFSRPSAKKKVETKPEESLK